MGILILVVIHQCMVSASFSCFLWALKASAVFMGPKEFTVTGAWTPGVCTYVLVPWWCLKDYTCAHLPGNVSGCCHQWVHKSQHSYTTTGDVDWNLNETRLHQ